MWPRTIAHYDTVLCVHVDHDTETCLEMNLYITIQQIQALVFQSYSVKDSLKYIYLYIACIPEKADKPWKKRPSEYQKFEKTDTSSIEILPVNAQVYQLCSKCISIKG